MKLLVDTHLVLWAAGTPERLSTSARSLIENAGNEPLFSIASLWEIVIKSGLGRPDFQVEPHLLRRGLIDNGWEELPITSVHALAVAHLPPLHKDPFDRMLLAQAECEGVTLLTGDAVVAQYPGPVQLV